MIILGAGLAGCIAGHLFPGSRILEAGSADSVGAHKALLRFRSDAISKITGIPFRKVRVHKAVVSEGQHYLRDVPPYLQNWYSRKVTGTISDRSISEIVPVDRWIAPEDFHAQLVERLNVEFDWPVDHVSNISIFQKGDAQIIDRRDEAVISTIPLPTLLKAAKMTQDHLLFIRAPIFVVRFTVPKCDVFQTVYYPDASTNIYRASLTGGLLIIESVKDAPTSADEELVMRSFGLDRNMLRYEFPTHEQHYGKIVPLPTDARHAILLRLTRELKVYSFGRFATWRNLLADDLPADAEKIRMLMRMTDYEVTLEGAK